MKSLYLIDGHSLIFKMYYAFLRKPMINSKGMDTSILFGVTKYILELVSREHPTHLAIAFDPPCKTFRHELFKEYKGTRSETPQLVIDALEPMTEICEALKIPVMMKPGFEADDVIGSMAWNYAGKGYDIYMVTVDKDYAQLLKEHVIQYKPGKSGAERELFTAEELCKKYNIANPLQFIDILTIWGDTADNIPGVKGVGEVGASRLISEYGSIEGIYDNLDKLKPKQKEAFEEARDRIALSRELATIRTDLDIEIPEDKLEINYAFDKGLAEIFDKYEFGSLRRLIPESSDYSGNHDDNTVIRCAPASIDQIADEARSSKKIALSLSGEWLISAAGNDSLIANTARMPLGDGEAETLRRLLGDPDITVVGHSLKQVYKTLESQGIHIAGKLRDVEILHYISDPEKSHKIDMLASSFLNINLSRCTLSGYEKHIGAAEDTGTMPDLFSQETQEQEEDITPKIAETAILIRLSEAISKKLVSDGMMAIYDDIEEPLIKVLADMESEGVKVDLEQLRRYRVKLESEMLEIEKEVRDIAGEPSLNLSSPKQLGIVLYEKMGLNPKIRKNDKKNYPTDEETLTALSDKSPIIQKILDFRGIKKLISTYIDPLPALLAEGNGKLHTTFNQALTATGRLSSSRPNLQNIPIRTEEGKEIRRAFIPSRSDGFILSADYSQIELRIMAHISCDRHMVEAFRNGEDIHAMTAAKIFKTTPDEVTKDQRRMAKTANFGIIYGISAFGLSQRLKISRQESKSLIDDYFKNFEGVEAYIRDSIAMARENGYVSTLFGRRRYLPDINSKNATVRSLAERNAINAPIQGSSADIIKLAMINIAARLKKEGMESKMILQVHDELIFDATADEAERLAAIVKEEMEGVVKLSVPLTVECNWAGNWLDAH